MGKIELLLEKTKRNGETTKWKVYLFAIVAIVIVAGLFFGVMALLTPIVDTYLSTNDRAVSVTALYDFYDMAVGKNETAVYFIGSSLIQYAIAPSEINRLLYEKGYDIKTYDLGVGGDRTELRTLQVNNIIDSSPSLVVYGISYITLSYENWISEYALLVSDRINISEDAYYLYSSNELDEILGNVDYASKNKIFLKSAIKQAITTPKKVITEVASDLSSDIWKRITGYNESFTSSFIKSPIELQRLKNIDNPNNPWRATVTNTTNREKEALLYNVDKLTKAGIPVIIINMPINPLLSEKITNESRQNFSNFLNTTGVKWYDMEKMFTDEYFADSHHLWSICGKDSFSPQMANLIIQELG